MPIRLIAIGLLAVLFAIPMIGDRLLRRRVEAEVEAMFDAAAGHEARVFGEADLEGLPDPVARCLRHAIEPGRSVIRCARLRQEGSMRLAPEAPWRPFTAVQYFTAEPPAFVWHARMAFMPLVWVAARDTYAGREGNMLIKVLSTLTVGNECGPELTVASLIRLVAEAMWYPTALLPSRYLRWEAIDESSARAVVDDDGVSASLVFHFAADGAIRRVDSADRVKDPGDPSPTPWFGEVLAWREIDGVRIPSEAEVSWGLESGDFAYWRGTITEIEYDVPTQY